MSITLKLYLAMTAAEMRQCRQLPQYPAWMACHFSPYGTGLSNFPQTLPPHSLLIVNDRTPIYDHDAHLISEQLTELANQLQINGILLDFQRPDNPQTAQLVQTLTTTLPCPVGVSDIYAAEGSYPVFVPPPLPNVPLETHLAPWCNREIWLEAALLRQCITITEAGAANQVCDFSSSNPTHFDEALFCHYQIETEPQRIRFLLSRTQDDLCKLLEHASVLGVTQAIGLYQELGAAFGRNEASAK